MNAFFWAHQKKKKKKKKKKRFFFLKMQCMFVDVQGSCSTSCSVFFFCDIQITVCLWVVAMFFQKWRMWILEIYTVWQIPTLTCFSGSPHSKHSCVCVCVCVCVRVCVNMSPGTLQMNLFLGSENIFWGTNTMSVLQKWLKNAWITPLIPHIPWKITIPKKKFKTVQTT